MTPSDAVARLSAVRAGGVDDVQEATSDAFLDRVKDLVQEQLGVANPDATVERTQYFNHSAIPDFVISWGRSSLRNVYLRGSYAAIIANGDAQVERRDDPVYMALDDTTEFGLGREQYDRERIADTVAESRTTLVTDFAAFASAASPRETGLPIFPLGELVRNNLTRGGRGLFDGEKVSLLVDGADADRPESLLAQVVGSFTEAVLPQFQRAAALIDLSKSDVGEFPLDLAYLLRGQLAPEEIRTLLPWILSNSSAGVGSPIWTVLGSLLDLDLLEEEWEVLQGLDLTRLAESNLHHFTAARTYAGLNADPEIGREGVEWRMLGATLARFSGAECLRFAHLGTRLRGYGSFPMPGWGDLRTRLGGFTLTGASVVGVDEEIRVESRSRRSIQAYLDQVIPPSSANEHFVETVTVRTHEDEDPDVVVRFADRIIQVPSGPKVSLSQFLSTVELLNPINPSLLE